MITREKLFRIYDALRTPHKLGAVMKLPGLLTEVCVTL